MSNIPEKNTWESVYEIKENDLVRGGADGTANRQAKALVNRTKYLKTKLDNLLAAAPDALDTFAELAAAIKNDANFGQSIISQLSHKEPRIAPKGTAFNKDFGNEEGTVAKGNHRHAFSEMYKLGENGLENNYLWALKNDGTSVIIKGVTDKAYGLDEEAGNYLATGKAVTEAYNRVDTLKGYKILKQGTVTYSKEFSTDGHVEVINHHLKTSAYLAFFSFRVDTPDNDDARLYDNITFVVYDKKSYSFKLIVFDHSNKTQNQLFHIDYIIVSTEKQQL